MELSNGIWKGFESQELILGSKCVATRLEIYLVEVRNLFS